METMTVIPDFMSDRNLPRTPPYTPHTPKWGIPRAESPAPSIHPIETISPKKKGPKRNSTIDNVKVEELVEGDYGYTTDTGLVYPDELEEPETGDENAMSSSSETDDPSDVSLLRRLSLLRCGDDSEVQFEKERRRRRELQRRKAPSHVKRSHSQSIQSAVVLDTIDPELLDDHDLTSTQRRLRRRTRGPEHYAEYSPQPSACSTPTAHLWDKHGHNLTPGVMTDNDDVGRDGEDDDEDDESDGTDDEEDENEDVTADNTIVEAPSQVTPAVSETKSANADNEMDVDSDSDEDL